MRIFMIFTVLMLAFGCDNIVPMQDAGVVDAAMLDDAAVDAMVSECDGALVLREENCHEYEDGIFALFPSQFDEDAQVVIGERCTVTEDGSECEFLSSEDFMFVQASGGQRVKVACELPVVVEGHEIVEGQWVKITVCDP